MGFETCPLLNNVPWITHGFFDSEHGVLSSHCGLHTFNNAETVFLKQDHTDRVLTNLNDVSLYPSDASITSQQDQALATKTADCCPILLVCTHSKQIAAIHAGWQGALNQITAKTIDVLVSRGAKLDHIIAAIGPSIHQDTYPVQDDLRDQFIQSSPDTKAYFTSFEDRWKLDVPGIVINQLKSKNVSTIWQSNINTFTNERYASHRRGQNGPPIRNVSIIMKTGE